MADNLLEMAARQLGSTGMGALGNALGLPAGKSEPALNAGLSTVLAGMMSKAGSGGLSSLLNMVTGSSNLDLSSLASVLGDPSQLGSLQKSGGNMLDGIFGSKQDGVTNALTSALGLSGGSGGGLLKVAAPVVMSLLGKMVKSKGLDAGGLGSLLAGQKPFIKDQLPSGILDHLGVSNLDSLTERLSAGVSGAAGAAQAAAKGAKSAAHGVKSQGQEVITKRGGFGKWFWPLLIALAALYALNMCAKRERVEAPAVIEDESVIMDEAPAPETPPATPEPQPETVAPDTSAADFGSRFRDFLASATRDPNREFPLDIHFASDSATPARDSFPDVQTLVSILQANPGLTVAIEGHTSSEGDETHNQQLSEERAQAVRQMLVNAGVDGNRITATGVGSAKPVADNATEEGREQNRRITVRALTF